MAAVLITALCAPRICCRSVSENSCEKHKLIPRDLGARTTQFYNNCSLVTVVVGGGVYAPYLPPVNFTAAAARSESNNEDVVRRNSSLG